MPGGSRGRVVVIGSARARGTKALRSSPAAPRPLIFAVFMQRSRRRRLRSRVLARRIKAVRRTRRSRAHVTECPEACRTVTNLGQKFPARAADERRGREVEDVPKSTAFCRV